MPLPRLRRCKPPDPETTGSDHFGPINLSGDPMDRGEPNRVSAVAVRPASPPRRSRYGRGASGHAGVPLARTMLTRARRKCSGPPWVRMLDPATCRRDRVESGLQTPESAALQRNSSRRPPSLCHEKHTWPRPADENESGVDRHAAIRLLGDETACCCSARGGRTGFLYFCHTSVEHPHNDCSGS